MEGHAAVWLGKHMPDMGSQQLTPPATGGQLFWQSLSLEHEGTHMPLPPPLDDPLPPLDVEPPPFEDEPPPLDDVAPPEVEPGEKPLPDDE
jgi:hypothetical protein